MRKVASFHSSNATNPDVHHCFADCDRAKLIPARNRRQGTGGYRLCIPCAVLQLSRRRQGNGSGGPLARSLKGGQKTALEPRGQHDLTLQDTLTRSNYGPSAPAHTGFSTRSGPRPAGFTGPGGRLPVGAGLPAGSRQPILQITRPAGAMTAGGNWASSLRSGWPSVRIMKSPSTKQRIKGSWRFGELPEIKTGLPGWPGPVGVGSRLGQV